MKKFLLVFIALIALDVAAKDIDRSFTGSWYNEDQSGHGFSVEVLPDGRAVIYWYVYNPDGTPTFLVALGAIDGDSVHADVYHQTGMKFGEFDNTNLEQTHWGTLDFTVRDCDNATLNYSSTMSHGGTPFGTGTIQLTRLASVAGLKCTTSSLHGNFHFTVIEDGQVGFGAAMLFANGDMAYFAASSEWAEVGLGTWRETGTGRFSFEATAYDILGGWEELSGSGTFFDDGLEASFTGGGQVIATRLQSFQQNLSYKDLSGTYRIDLVGVGDVGTLTVREDGSVSGSTHDGCSISGIVFIPVTQFSQAYFDVDVTDCADAGRAVGAFAYDYNEDLIVAFGSDGWNGLIWQLQ
jgi:hypothetical protein